MTILTSVAHEILSGNSTKEEKLSDLMHEIAHLKCVLDLCQNHGFMDAYDEHPLDKYSHPFEGEESPPWPMYLEWSDGKGEIIMRVEHTLVSEIP